MDLFFVLSGFLIGGILLEARSATNYFSVFYTRRFFRIVPIYFAVLLLLPDLTAFGEWTRHGNFRWFLELSTPWYSYWTFTQNFWMADELRGRLWMTWSLAVEEQSDFRPLPLLLRLTSPCCFLCSLVSARRESPHDHSFLLADNWVGLLS